MNIQKTSDVKVLEAHIRRRVWGQVSDLRLQVLDGCVLLQGHAPTYYLKQLAQHAALEASHLPLAANEIEVACPG